MNGGTYAEAFRIFKSTEKSGFFSGLGCTIKNYVADVMVNYKYRDCEPTSGGLNMNEFIKEAENAGFSNNEIDFIQRFIKETINEAMTLGFSKIDDHEKKNTFKAKCIAKLRNVADRMENTNGHV